MQYPEIEQQITFLYTRDLVATAHFYEQVIGLRLWRDQGACRIYSVAPGALVGFCQRTDAAERHDDIIFTLVTPDVDGWYQALQAKGMVFEKAPQVNSQYNIYHCFLRDPNGYLIEIQRFM